MKQKIQSIYKKYGIKAVVVLGIWWVVKWSALIFFGKEILERIR